MTITILASQYRNVAPPKERKLGNRPRRIADASMLGHFRALGKSLALCHTCEWMRLPLRWAKRWEYAKVPNLHTTAERCDYCRKTTSCNLYVPESGKLWQEHLAHDRIERQQIRVTDRRRVRG